MGGATYEQRGSTEFKGNDAETSVPYLFYYEQMLAVALMEQPIRRV
jgi:hypothetical protein